MIDVAADEGWLATTLRIMHLVQMCVQGRWISDASIMTLPRFNVSRLAHLKKAVEKSSLPGISNLREFSNLPELLMLYQQHEKLVKSAISTVVEQYHHTKEVCKLNLVFVHKTSTQYCVR